MGGAREVTCFDRFLGIRRRSRGMRSRGRAGVLTGLREACEHLIEVNRCAAAARLLATANPYDTKTRLLNPKKKKERMKRMYKYITR